MRFPSPFDRNRKPREPYFDVSVRENPHLLLELDAGEILEPGGNADGKIKNVSTAGAFEYQKRAGDDSVTVYDNPDSKAKNCFLPSEEVPVIWDPNLEKWVTHGSYGLLRKAKANAAISAGSSGTVTVWVNGMASTFTPTAHSNWSSGDVAQDDEIWIKYCPDEQKWIIVFNSSGTSLYIGKATTIITARSSDTPGSGNADHWIDTGTVYSNTSDNYALKNPWQAQIPVGTYIMFAKIGDYWELVAADCEPGA